MAKTDLVAKSTIPSFPSVFFPELIELEKLWFCSDSYSVSFLGDIIKSIIIVGFSCEWKGTY